MLAGILLACTQITGGAQEAGPTVFRSEIQLLEVEVRATGRDGKPVPDLEIADFTLTDDGQPREIATLDFVGTPLKNTGTQPAPSRPLTWVYIATEVDDAEVPQVRTAVERFLQQQFHPGLMVSIGGTPFTNNRDRLQPAVDVVGRGSFVGEDPAKKLALNHYLALINDLGKRRGKKIIVLFRSQLRINVRNLMQLNRIREAALRHRVSIYTMHSRGLESAAQLRRLPLASSSRDVTELHRANQARYSNRIGLKILAERTGGRAIANTNNFGAVFDAVLEDTQSYYLLGYYPPSGGKPSGGKPSGNTPGGKFRKIDVKVRRPGVKLQATRGYW
ncbi:MAG: VWA domain-containing protein, partial [bacterium]|nr:VWA domain-containing protein [bacterium]